MKDHYEEIREIREKSTALGRMAKCELSRSV